MLTHTLLISKNKVKQITLQINREVCKLNYIIEQMNSTDVCKTFHANTEGCTTSAFHVTFSKMDHVLEHKTSQQIRAT